MSLKGSTDLRDALYKQSDATLEDLFYFTRRAGTKKTSTGLAK